MKARNLQQKVTARLAVEPLENRIAPVMYMNYETVPGASMPRHDDQIEVMSFQLGVQPAQAPNAARQSTSSSLIDLSIVRRDPPATPQLFLKCCTGQHIPDAVLTARTPGAQQSYMRYEFEDVFVSSVRPGGGSDSVYPLEEVTFHYMTLKFQAFAGGVRVGDVNADGFQE